jgi:putative transposase
MKINKAFKFRIYPNKEQLLLIQKTFGCVRFTYNRFLNQRIELYKSEQKSTTYVNQAKELTALKKELPWLKKVDSVSLQSSLRNLDTAFKNFFQKRAKYPKFKSKRNNTKSYTTKNTNNSIRIEDAKLKLPKLGLLKAKFHRQIPQNYKTCQSSKKTITYGKIFKQLVQAKN